MFVMIRISHTLVKWMTDERFNQTEFSTTCEPIMFV
jgi:hypothetical protein